MNPSKIATQLYNYTYPKVQLQNILDLISENFYAGDSKAWEKTMKYYKKAFGHNWTKYVYDRIDYPDIYKLDIIASFKDYYDSIKEESMMKRLRTS